MRCPTKHLRNPTYVMIGSPQETQNVTVGLMNLMHLMKHTFNISHHGDGVLPELNQTLPLACLSCLGPDELCHEWNTVKHYSHLLPADGVLVHQLPCCRVIEVGAFLRKWSCYSMLHLGTLTAEITFVSMIDKLLSAPPVPSSFQNM